MPNVVGVMLAVFQKRHRETHFQATVVDKTGGTIRVRRDGEDAEPLPYAAFSGVAALVSAGDRVGVVDFTGDGGWVVVGKIVSS